ncbi:Zn-ribbon domain-containing OB-fold protein [Bordetella genomosp. 7]|uniref:DNA-binding protein n=1 Tax=Bordetella genomosp. 7 TaxID=1416805 RepID=A0A261QYJ6_9BORD|nr:Zn-ribbon domain-containing OB-fold protein [Bordetella genomosp. 7]OZI17153.1 DNA-binding protein [Bordetella genomosp. 7]
MPDTQSTEAIGPDRYFHDRLAQGRFLIQHCAACSRHVFYPRMLCPHCGGSQLDWVAPSGRGTIYSTTVIRRRPEQGGDYHVALVDLEEGVRMMSRVEGVAPAAVKIGMQVQAAITRGEDGNQIVFRLA